jgi:hypothetical protein
MGLDQELKEMEDDRKEAEAEARAKAKANKAKK